MKKIIFLLFLFLSMPSFAQTKVVNNSVAKSNYAKFLEYENSTTPELFYVCKECGGIHGGSLSSSLCEFCFKKSTSLGDEPSIDEPNDEPIEPFRDEWEEDK